MAISYRCFLFMRFHYDLEPRVPKEFLSLLECIGKEVGANNIFLGISRVGQTAFDKLAMERSIVQPLGLSPAGLGYAKMN